MAERKTQTRRPATRQRGAASGGPDALGRLNDSIEAAQAALKDLRSEMSRGSRDLLKDLDKALRDARKNLGRTSRRIAKDLDEVPRPHGASGRPQRGRRVRATAPRGGAPPGAAPARRSRSGHGAYWDSAVPLLRRTNGRRVREERTLAMPGSTRARAGEG